jgi:Ca2+-binding EF-hand superfamily protein
MEEGGGHQAARLAVAFQLLDTDGGGAIPYSRLLDLHDTLQRVRRLLEDSDGDNDKKDAMVERLSSISSKMGIESAQNSERDVRCSSTSTHPRRNSLFDSVKTAVISEVGLGPGDLEADRTVSFQEFCAAIAGKPRFTFLQQFTLGFLLPVLSGFVTFVPFSLFDAQADALRMGYASISVLSGCAQACRVLTNVVYARYQNSAAATAAFLLLAMLALLANCLLPDSKVALFFLPLAALAEITTYLQSAAVEDANYDPAVYRPQLAVQYAFVLAGQALGLFAGSKIFFAVSYGAATGLGGVMALLAFITLAGYFASRPPHPELRGVVASIASVFYCLSAVFEAHQKETASDLAAPPIARLKALNASLKGPKQIVQRMLPTETLINLKLAFLVADTDGDRSLDRSELKRLSKACGMPEITEEVLAFIDLNGDGLVDEDEFIYACSPFLLDLSQGDLMNSVSSDEFIGPSGLARIVALTNAFVNVGSSLLLAVAILYQREKFPELAPTAGSTVLAIGEAAAALTVLSKGLDWGSKLGLRRRRWMRRPYNVAGILFLLGAACIISLSPFFALVSIGWISATVLNKFGSAELNEFLAGLSGRQFREIQSVAQISKRTTGVLLGFLGPLLYSFRYWSPFVVSTVGVWSWASVYLWCFRVRRKQLEQSLPRREWLTMRHCSSLAMERKASSFQSGQLLKAMAPISSPIITGRDHEPKAQSQSTVD